MLPTIMLKRRVGTAKGAREMPTNVVRAVASAGGPEHNLSTGEVTHTSAALWDLEQCDQVPVRFQSIPE